MLLLTSCSWGSNLSALWTMDNFFDQKIGFPYDQYVEFSKLTQDRILGTSAGTAKVQFTRTPLQPLLIHYYTSYTQLLPQSSSTSSTHSPTHLLLDLLYSHFLYLPLLLHVLFPHFFSTSYSSTSSPLPIFPLLLSGSLPI